MITKIVDNVYTPPTKMSGKLSEYFAGKNVKFLISNKLPRYKVL